MSIARAQTTIEDVSVVDAEQLWYDSDQWPLFIDGMRSLVSVEGDPPRSGARIVWESNPAGRGRVTETAVHYTPGSGQELEVEDAAIRGRQQVRFTADGNGVTVSLQLDYQLKSANPLRAVTDWLFIRRSQNESLSRTLAAFRFALDDARGQSPSS